MTFSVTLDCSSISQPNIVIDDAFDATYMLMQDGLGRPAITWRLTPMPDSADVHGTEYVAAVKEQTSLPLQVMVQASSTAALDTAITKLEDALSQFTYTATVVADGITKVWSCSPASWSATSGVIDAAMVLAHYEVLTITVPVYPIPGA